MNRFDKFSSNIGFHNLSDDSIPVAPISPEEDLPPEYCTYKENQGDVVSELDFKLDFSWWTPFSVSVAWPAIILFNLKLGHQITAGSAHFLRILPYSLIQSPPPR
jgi:hypothetical protein